MDTEPVTRTRSALVALPAEIDITNAHGVREQIAAAFTPGVEVVIADMTATTFCDARGIRALVLARQRAVANGAELRLLRPCRDVVRMMELLGLDRALAIFQNLEGALVPGPRPRVRIMETWV